MEFLDIFVPLLLAFSDAIIGALYLYKVIYTYLFLISL